MRAIAASREKWKGLVYDSRQTKTDGELWEAFAS
jgi:hypothetical protein